MKVNTQRLEEQAAQLRYISHTVSGIQESVLRTSRMLSRESIGAAFRNPIRKVAGDLENRAEELMKMSRVLQDIAGIYERTERDIVDESEHANIHHGILPTGLIPIPPLPTNIFDPRQDYPRPDISPDFPEGYEDVWNSWSDDTSPIGDWTSVLRQFQPVGNQNTPEVRENPNQPGDVSGGIDWTPWDGE